MKKQLCAFLCGAMLFLTACGGETEAVAEKDHYYEVLDNTGTAVYTVTEGPLIDTLDNILGTPTEDMEPVTGQMVDPLYTYVYWQEETLHAGEDPDAERNYQELMHILVPAEGEAIVVQVFPSLDDLEGLHWLTDRVDLETLLTSTVTVSSETAEALRDPAQFAK